MPEIEQDQIAAAVSAVEEMRSASEQFRTTQAAELRTVTDRLAAVETRLNRPQGGAENRTEPSAERRAFRAYLRHGPGTPAEELRALTVSSDPGGGYMAPPEVASEFIRNLIEFSPIRSLASVRTTAAASVKYPTRTGITNAKWGGETQAQQGSQPTFGQLEIVPKEITTYVDISNQLLADSGGAAEAEVNLALSEDFGQKEALAFVSGNGVLQPQGILSHPGVAYKATGNASTLGSNPADMLIDFYYSLPATYRGRGTWLMNGKTLAEIRKLKDGTTGVYLWQPAYAAGQPETILGRPVVEAIDFPDIGAGNEPIAFGDIATAYRIVDRVSLSLLINPYSLADQGITRIHATRRVGGGVVQPAALKKIRCAVS